MFTCRWLPANQEIKALVFLCHGMILVVIILDVAFSVASEPRFLALMILIE
jgi:hypothetical protein